MELIWCGVKENNEMLVLFSNVFYMCNYDSCCTIVDAEFSMIYWIILEIQLQSGMFLLPSGMLR